VLVTAPSGLQSWRGPYLQRGVPKDPWGNPYEYRQPGQHNPSGFDLFSLGPDGREGNDDIGNWNE
jgi:general secretion pathway protein G